VAPAKREVLRPLAEQWFARMQQCGDGVRELMHDGRRVEEALFGCVNVFTAHVTVVFSTARRWRTRQACCEGTGKYVRQLKLRSGGELDDAALGS
jgi:hypothetical protein